MGKISQGSILTHLHNLGLEVNKPPARPGLVLFEETQTHPRQLQCSNHHRLLSPMLEFQTSWQLQRQNKIYPKDARPTASD